MVYGKSFIGVIRFIAGGREVLTNHTYVESPANITISDFRLHGTDTVIFFRSPRDWGWVGVTQRDGALIATFDRKRGFLHYDAEFLHTEAGEKRTIHELRSPLKYLPMNAVYI